jgi:DDE family transposase
MEFFTLPDHLRGPHPRCQHADPGTVRSHHPTDTTTRPVTESEQTGLLHALSAVPDHRSLRGLRYPIGGLLSVAVCAVMAGASSVTAIMDWLRDRDDMPGPGSKPVLYTARQSRCSSDSLVITHPSIH